MFANMWTSRDGDLRIDSVSSMDKSARHSIHNAQASASDKARESMISYRKTAMLLVR